MSAAIHPTAIVEDGARLGDGVKIGPFCHVGQNVTLAEEVELLSHVVVAGHTSVGAVTKIYPFASIGHPPQDLKYKGEPTTLVIGKNCLIREGVTMNPGTVNGRGVTTVGDNGFFLANSHVAHDCVIGDNVVLANNVMLGGHSAIGNFTILSGGAAVQQNVRVGPHVFTSGFAAIWRDVIPYGAVFGFPAHMIGLNLVGLKRRGFSRDAIHDLRRAYRLLFAEEGTLQERVADVAEEFAEHPVVNEIIAFIRQGGERSLTTPKAEEPVA